MRNDAESAMVFQGLSSYQGAASGRQPLFSASGFGVKPLPGSRRVESDAAARERIASADRNGAEILSFGTIAGGLVLGALLPGEAQAYGLAHASRTTVDNRGDDGSDHAPVPAHEQTLSNEHGQAPSTPSAPIDTFAPQPELPPGMDRPAAGMDALEGGGTHLVALDDGSALGRPGDGAGGGVLGIAAPPSQVSDGAQLLAMNHAGSSGPPSLPISLDMPQALSSDPEALVNAIALPTHLGNLSATIDQTLASIDKAIDAGGSSLIGLGLPVDLPVVSTLLGSVDAVGTLVGNGVADFPLTAVTANVVAVASPVLAAVDGVESQLGDVVGSAAPDLASAAGSVVGESVGEVVGVLQPLASGVLSHVSDNPGGALVHEATDLARAAGDLLPPETPIADGLLDGLGGESAVGSVANLGTGPVDQVAETAQTLLSPVLGNEHADNGDVGPQRDPLTETTGRVIDLVTPASHSEGSGAPASDHAGANGAGAVAAAGLVTDLAAAGAGGQVGSAVGTALGTAIDLGQPPSSDRSETEANGGAAHDGVSSVAHGSALGGDAGVTHAAAEVIQAPPVHVGFAGQSYVDTVDSHDHGLASANGLLHGLV